MRQIGGGLVGATRRRLPLLRKLCIISLGCVVRRGRRIVIAEGVGVCKGIGPYPSRNPIGNSRSERRPVWPSIAPGTCIRWASAEIAGNSLRAAGDAQRSVNGRVGRACGSVGNGGAEASVERLSGVAREAAAKCGPLGAGRKRNPNQNQRNRGETLHEDILQLFAYCGLAATQPADSSIAHKEQDRALSRCSQTPASRTRAEATTAFANSCALTIGQLSTCSSAAIALGCTRRALRTEAPHFEHSL